MRKIGGVAISLLVKVYFSQLQFHSPYRSKIFNLTSKYNSTMDNVITYTNYVTIVKCALLLNGEQVRCLLQVHTIIVRMSRHGMFTTINE